MNKFILAQYLNKQVKIVLKDRYIHRGEITQVLDDCFKLDDGLKTMWISNDSIQKLQEAF